MSSFYKVIWTAKIEKLREIRHYLGRDFRYFQVKSSKDVKDLSSPYSVKEYWFEIISYWVVQTTTFIIVV